MTNRLGAMGQKKYKGLTVLQNGHRVFNGTIRLDEEALSIPLRRKKPTTYFVNSMSDLFWGDADDLKTARRLGTANPTAVPFEFIDKVFAVMALCPQHTFQVLTKRPERMAEYLASPDLMERLSFLLGRSGIDGMIGGLGFLKEGSSLGNMACVWSSRFDSIRTGIHHKEESEWWPLPNIWLGTSIENQKAADERILWLLKCPAKTIFLSIEPQLGRIVLPENFLAPNFADDDPRAVQRWVIQGGESGPGARPFWVEWARTIRDQCADFGCAYFLKQLGAYVKWNGTHGGYGDGPSNVWPKLNHEQDTGGGFRVRLKSSKGGDPSEWPEDIRIRQFPEARAEVGR